MGKWYTLIVPVTKNKIIMKELKVSKASKVVCMSACSRTWGSCSVAVREA